MDTDTDGMEGWYNVGSHFKEMKRLLFYHF